MEGSDYINASFIDVREMYIHIWYRIAFNSGILLQGYDGQKNAYIAAQGLLLLVFP